jgi:hypothetical protein
MKIRIITAAGLVVFLLALQGCTNTQPAYYGTYPSNYNFGANHGYEPYASAPYDPVGGEPSRLRRAPLHRISA